MSTRHLVISVTFLQPMCHARLGKGETAPNEWPPSPLRLFQAMVAGAAARWAGAAGPVQLGGITLTSDVPVAALKWLENLCSVTPPTIVAPEAAPGKAVPHYVPNNSGDLVAARWAKGNALAAFEDRVKKTFRPTHLLGGQTVHYLWPLDDVREREARLHEPAIAAMARSIVALGWGIDAAFGDARIMDANGLADLAGERWIPGRIGAPGLRTPVARTLDDLSARHGAFLRRLQNGVFTPVPPLRQFATVPYRRASDLPVRPFAAFLLRPPEKDTGYAAFAGRRATCVAAMLRHAACKAAQEDVDESPDAWRTAEWSLRFVAGHGPPGESKRRRKDDNHPRFSYLPLRSIGHPHADGMIRRALIAEPFGSDGRSARWIEQRLAGAELIDEHTRTVVARLEPVRPDDPDFDHVFHLYAARSEEAATVWTSVTPVILPGYDDNKRAKRERLVLECLRHAGIDAEAVDSVEVRRAAWFSGITESLSAFKRPCYLQHLPAWHVRLVFRRAVSGPLSLGAGRHCGLGVLARQ
ncbi:MAG TPA: type I-U CRISPR-associated protein Csb2 [Planctomycetota bacterium]|nr:type I-U CRISPR-associated protein Csb2 [Planctomycetota bacterium]